MMPEYRAYVVGSDGHFIDAFELECADDTEAMERAKQLVNGHDIEHGSASARSRCSNAHRRDSNEKPRLDVGQGRACGIGTHGGVERVSYDSEHIISMVTGPPGSGSFPQTRV
jgi:hypothetical protein